MITTVGRRLVAVVAAAGLSVLPMSLGAVADAAVKAKHYPSCSALQKDYPHGVGRKGAKDRTSGQPVTSFTVSSKVYAMNDGPRNAKTGEYDLDRDNDGIACERR